MVVGKTMVCKNMVDKNMPVEIVLKIVPYSDVRSMVTLGRVSKHYYEILIEDVKGLWDRVASLSCDDARFLSFIDGCRKLADLRLSVSLHDQTERVVVEDKFVGLPFSKYRKYGDLDLKWKIESEQFKMDNFLFKIEMAVRRCLVSFVPRSARLSCLEMMPAYDNKPIFFAYSMFSYFFGGIYLNVYIQHSWGIEGILDWMILAFCAIIISAFIRHLLGLWN